MEKKPAQGEDGAFGALETGLVFGKRFWKSSFSFFIFVVAISWDETCLSKNRVHVPTATVMWRSVRTQGHGHLEPRMSPVFIVFTLSFSMSLSGFQTSGMNAIWGIPQTTRCFKWTFRLSTENRYC